MMRRILTTLLLAGCLPVAGADSPSDAVAAFLESLEAGKTTPADNETVVLSPFAPKEKKKNFKKALAELAEQIEGAISSIEAVAAPKDRFAGFRLVLRQKQNPLQVIVRPICVLRTEDGAWKVAAGLANFDNTNFGFEENLGEMARQVAEATRRDAEESGRRLLAQGAEALWKDIRTLREKWPKDSTPEDQVKRFLEYDEAGDPVGKLACFHITPDLPAASLERFLTLLSDTTHPTQDTGSGEEDAAGAKVRKEARLSISLGGHEVDGKVCRVMGFMNQQDPSDYYVQAFYLRKGEGNRWLLFPDGYEVEGLRSPDTDLVSWYEENETSLSKKFIMKISELGRMQSPPSKKREDGAAMVERYLDAMANRRLPEAFALLDFPPEDMVDDFDGLMEELALAPPRAGGPVILALRWREVGDFGGAVHAVFQPEATRPFLLHIQKARWTNEGWRVLPPPWEDGPESLIHQPDARKLQTELEAGWEEMKTGAIQRIFGESRGKAAKDAAAEEVVRDLVATAFADAVANRQKEYLAAWKPLKGGQIDPVSALEMASRLGKDLRRTGKIPEAEFLVRGDLVGILLPLNQAKRKDGKKPARMIIARCEDDVWTLVPGLEFFRPVNRGFTALNQKALAAGSTAFDEAGRGNLKDLLSWLEQSPPEKKPE